MKAVIFDMDGLLIDSERPIHDAMIYAGKIMGIKDAGSTSLRCLGVTKEGTRKIFCERYGEDFDFARCEELKHEYLDKTVPEKFFPAKPYAKDILISLRNAGFLTALASSTRREWVEPSLEFIGVSELLPVKICGGDVTASKPDPEIFLKAAGKLGVPPSECFVLEDSYNGIRAAYAAGTVPIMIPDLVAPDDEMLRLASYTAKDLRDAERFIMNYSAQG